MIICITVPGHPTYSSAEMDFQETETAFDNIVWKHACGIMSVTHTIIVKQACIRVILKSEWAQRILILKPPRWQQWQQQEHSLPLTQAGFLMFECFLLLHAKISQGSGTTGWEGFWERRLYRVHHSSLLYSSKGQKVPRLNQYEPPEGRATNNSQGWGDTRAWVMWNGTWVFAKGTGEIEGPD